MPQDRAPHQPWVETLTELNIADLLESIGLSRLRGARRCRACCIRQPTASPGRRTSSTTVSAPHGLGAGQRVADEPDDRWHRHLAWRTCRRRARWAILANHPGMTDTVALFTSLASRPDLRVIASDRPFLRALPNVARQLIFLPDEEDGGRMAVVRMWAPGTCRKVAPC